VAKGKPNVPSGATQFEHAVTLRGIQPKDQEAHVQARAAFLNCLRDDPTVTALFKTFGGIVDAAWTLAADGDRLAARAGLGSRADLLAGDETVFEKAMAGHEAEFEAYHAQFIALDASRPSTRFDRRSRSCDRRGRSPVRGRG
jgi:hypothetical protein